MGDEEKESPYIAKVYEYRPAPGQFINDPSFGMPASAAALIGTTNGLVSLGGFGGYIIFGFDHPVKNRSGADIGIFGNPLISAGSEWSEPGIVCVMQDSNKNGIPDDGEWFELAGSEHKAGRIVRNYQITYHQAAGDEDVRWEDNQGNSGFILKNNFHLQAYYPTWLKQASITFEGTLLQNTLSDAGTLSNQPFSSGYADNGSANYLSLQEKNGRGYNTFDIDWAIDKNGKNISLGTIDFIKVYTAQNCNGNPVPTDHNNPKARLIGEVSTEVAGAVDLSLYP